MWKPPVETVKSISESSFPSTKGADGSSKYLGGSFTKRECVCATERCIIPDTWVRGKQDAYNINTMLHKGRILFQKEVNVGLQLKLLLIHDNLQFLVLFLKGGIHLIARFHLTELQLHVLQGNT